MSITSYYKYKSLLIGDSASKNLVPYNSHNLSLLCKGNCEITENLYCDASLNLFGRDLTNSLNIIDSSLNSINNSVSTINTNTNNNTNTINNLYYNVNDNTNNITEILQRITALSYTTDSSGNGITYLQGYLNPTNGLYVNSTKITPTQLSYLYGITSNIQNNFDSLFTTIGNNTNTINGLYYSVADNINSLTGITYNSTTDLTIINNNLSVSGTINNITPTQISYLSGISSNIQIQINGINSNMSSIYTLSDVQNQTINILNYSTFLRNTNHQQNIYIGNDNTTISGCVIKSPNPQFYYQSISNQISANNGNVLISEIQIGGNQFINMSYSCSIDFYKNITSYVFQIHSNSNQFTNSLNNITFQIYKDYTLLKTIIVNVNYTETYWGTGTGNTSYYTITIPSIFLDSCYLYTSSIYQIYANASQGGTNSTSSYYNNYKSQSNSYFLYNSSNSSYPSQFTFSYNDDNNRVSGISTGAILTNQVTCNSLFTGNICNYICNMKNINTSQSGSAYLYTSNNYGFYLMTCNSSLGKNESSMCQVSFFVWFMQTGCNINILNNPSGFFSIVGSSSNNSFTISCTTFTSNYINFNLYGSQLF
jgi:hypothetical protein